ncbi:MAG TPA: ABC transporter permease, partial [Candidatus Nitrosocosmicus sp.]|nr:ABC transporter permease [Candidatus Nitrosocosmicus sp.]
MKYAEMKSTARYAVSSAGIIIGIAVAMVILGIADGGRAVLNQGFWSEGVKVYDIELKEVGLMGAGYLEWEDARLIDESMPEAKGSIPVLKMDSQLKSYKASFTAATFAVNEKFRQYANLEMVTGRFINEQDVHHANKVAVIDDLTAIELFGTTDILGQKLKVQVGGKNVEFTVSGVCRNFNRNIETLFKEEFPALCYIPDSVPEDVSFEYSVDKLIALVSDNLHEEEAASRLSHLLEKEHGVEGVYSVEEYEQLTGADDFTSKYAAFAVIIAVVALISGGIAVMNSMLLTIRERKKEIGLYKFYGAGIR